MEQDGVARIDPIIGRSTLASLGASQIHELPTIRVHLSITGGSTACCATCGEMLVEPELIVDTPHEAEERSDHVAVRQMARMECKSCRSSLLKIMIETNYVPA